MDSGQRQFGPGIAAQPGLYRARWVGTAEAPAGSSLGFVEVWFGAERVARAEVVAGEGRPDHVLASLDFTVPREGVDSLEYRFFVNGGVRMALERVELYSGEKIPRK